MTNWSRKIRSGLTPLYIAKHGDDTNGDGTEGNPYKTLSVLRHLNFPTLQNRHVIIGDGVYLNENTNLLNPSNVIIEGDGNVVITNSVDPYALRVSGSLAELKNVKIVDSVIGIESTTNRGFDTIDSIIIYNCTKSFTFEQEQNFAVKISNSLFVGVGTATANQSRLRFDNGQLFSSYINNTMIDDRLYIYNRDNDNATCIVENSIFNNCEIETDKKANGTVVFRNCNFHNSIFIIEGIAYADYATALTAVPQFFENCIDSDPLFTDPAADDYTLQSVSPCLTNSSDGTQIGCYGQGYSSRVDEVGVVTSNININSGEATLNSPGEGTIQFVDKDFGKDLILSTIKILGTEDYVNDAVVDYSLDRLLPNHRTIKLKTVTNQDIVDAGGNVSTALDAAIWKEFIIGLEPTIDASGTANGESGFDRNTHLPIIARAYRAEIKLRDNGIKS